MKTNSTVTAGKSGIVDNSNVLARQAESKRRTATEWLVLIRDWEQSGDTQQSFCERRKINYNTFKYWRHRLRGQTKVPEAQHGKFSSCRIKRSCSSHLGSTLRILYPSGMQILLNLNDSSQLMKAILQSVGEL